MSNTQYFYFPGIARFVRSDNTDQYGNYICKIELDGDSLKAYRESGIQVNVDDENAVFLRRPHQKIFGDSLETLGPPAVVDADGKPLAKRIGNGSKIVAKVKAYPTRKGKGHTLEAIQVLELKEYVSASGSNFYNF